MATTQARPSRKRKAEEAEIESRGPGELKRLRLEPDANPEPDSAPQIKKPSPDDVHVPDASISSASNPQPTASTATATAAEEAAPDPFAAFADYSAKTDTASTAEAKQEQELSSTGWPDMASNGGGFGSFGSAAVTDASNGGGWGQATEFKFGADDADFDLNKIVASPPKKTEASKSADVASGEADEADEAIAQLTGAVDSGDGNDRTVHSVLCTVYELDAEVNRYKEKGVGEVRLNTYNNNGSDSGEEGKLSARLLCRQLLTFKTLINCALQSDTHFVKVNERNVRFTVFEQVHRDVDNEETETEAVAVAVTKTYLLKLKEPGKGKIDEFTERIKEIQTKM